MSLKQRIFVVVSIASLAGLLFAMQSSARSYRYRSFLKYKRLITPMGVDSPSNNAPVDLPYPIEDREGDFVSQQVNNPFYLEDPPAIEKDVEYDPETGMYVITEKVNGKDIRPPMYMTYEEYMKYTEKQEINSYWKERGNAINLIEEKGLVPPIQVKKQFFDKLFGGSKIEIKPQGNLEVTIGGNYQKTDNPNIPEQNRKTGNFDFDMNINMSVIGKIGDKLQLGIKYNTQTGFQLDNQIKLEYSGDQDDIIKKIEVGNVSLPLTTQLITGSQALFGFKTQLQFGRLTWTTIFSQQQSKRENIKIENGSQRQQFELRSDQYEENRHFFMAQFFRDQYEFAMGQLPNIRSVVNITRAEVWVTNKTGVTLGVRDVVGFMDLGESSKKFSPAIQVISTDPRPDNGTNDLYPRLASDPTIRTVDNIVNALQGPQFQLKQAQDYEKTYARKLNESEYVINRQLGFISMNTQLNPNDVLAVAFQYEYNGQVYQVGEFSNQVPPDSNSTSKVLYLKLLKGTSVRTNLPIWNLMMKNVYSLGAYQISNEDFRLDIYYNDPGGGEKRYLPKGNLHGVPLIKLTNLDNVNMNGDPQPDGLFDFLPNVTLNTQNGRLFFPVVEPFGDWLRGKFNGVGDNALADQYVYDQLYDSTRFVAQQFPEYNRFLIKGQYKGSNSSEINLGGKVPKGSVTVTAGGQKLTEGVHYTINYDLGRISIIDPSIQNSGKQIEVSFENNNQFATQVRTLFGTRLDYKVNPKLNIGGTVMNLRERPFTQKVNVGDDPINNTIMGLDIAYQSNMKWLTKALDKLPVYSTKEMSTISAYGEMAYMKPGHNKAINNGDEGQLYIDDFEGTSNGSDLKTAIQWKLASTPREMVSNGKELFPESKLINDYRYGYNRSKLAWYRIDNVFFNGSDPNAEPVYNNTQHIKSHYARLIDPREIFPNRPVTSIDPTVYTFDLFYTPKDRGQYNYESSSNPTTLNGKVMSYGINTDGSLKEPQTRWAGIMRNMQNNTDLEATNVEFIEFWMMDPFLYNPVSQGGKLYFHLGNISEDVLRDSRYFYENGLGDTTGVDETKWSYVPKLPPLVNAFDNNEATRVLQDVGFDGSNDATEQVKFQQFLTDVQPNVDATAFAKLQSDPSTDDFAYYNSADDPANTIFDRYRKFNNPDGNSPVVTSSFASGTNIPDGEDMNGDNTLNENEEYFQYEIDLKPGMVVGSNPYIISVVDESNNNQIGRDNDNLPCRWIQFRVPIRQYQSKVGNIPDFKSIQFMRMLMTGWQDSVVLRFATLELIRNQWRTYNLPLNEPCEILPSDDDETPFYNLSSVSIEENSGKTPVNYVMPPGIQREQALGNQTNQYVQQNEQALALTVCDLQDCKMKAVFKNMNLDLRRYKNMVLDIHANRVESESQIQDKDVTALLRIGSDFKDNYYQFESPLLITPDGQYNGESDADRLTVWPAENQMNIPLQSFIDLKQERNAQANYPRTVPYKKTLPDGKIISIVGNPDLGDAKTIMLGVRNPAKDDPNNPKADDDGQAKCIEVWFNELRISGLEEFGGVAAVGNVNIKLADLGNIAVSGGMHQHGFGQIEQKIDQRYKDDMYQYDVSGNLELGRFVPEVVGLRLPFYGTYAQTFSIPEFDPYQFDVTSKDVFNSVAENFGKDSLKVYKQQVMTINTRRGYNFSNVRIVPKTKAKKPHIYDPGNFNFTWAYNEQIFSDPFIEKNSRKTYLANVNWAFSPQGKDLYPFKKLIKSKTKWLDIIRDINFNYLPSTMAVTNEWNREFGEIKLRSLGDDEFPIPSTYNKFFRWNRGYQFKYNPFKSLSIDFSANNQARIDEPDGELDTKAKRDTMWDNFWNGGRNTAYNQQLGVNYNLPINKIPLFDFITASVGYNATYNWTALPQVKDSLGRWVQNPYGNIINNTQNDRAKVEFNFKKIYDKSPFLKVYNSPNPSFGNAKETKTKRDAVKKARDKIKDEIKKLKDQRDKLKDAYAVAKKDTSVMRKAKVKKAKADLKANRKAIRAKRKDLRSKQYPANPGISLFLRPLLMIKKIGVEYKENKATLLPGFTGYSRILGVDYKAKSPDWGFVFGNQPGDNFFYGTNKTARQEWLDDAASKGWIVRDTLLNQKFTQTKSQRLDVTATLEPYPDLKIDLNMFVDYTKNFTELYKVRTEGGPFEALNPMEMGTYSVSYIPVNTFFTKIDAKGYSETYQRFEENRKVISQRLGVENPYYDPTHPFYINPSDTNINTATNPNYVYGYGPKSQDVLIPAFLAAYTKQDPTKVNLNPFKQIPLPNWRISYNGLSKIDVIKKVLTNINITHAYTSTLSVSGFQTNLDFRGGSDLFQQQRLDTLSGNYYTFYNMPSVVINEQFSPLIGIDMTFAKNVTAKFDYKKSRTMTLGFTDFQMVENMQEQFTIGAGYKVKGLKLPIKIKGKQLRLDNELNFKFDFSYRDMITINHRIDEAQPQITSGSRVYTVQPSIDYVISKRLNIRLFYDMTKTIPKISTGFTTTNTRAGIVLRFSLSE